MPDHNLSGNCWGIGECALCKDALCDVCHEHDVERGECDECDTCEKCDPVFEWDEAGQ